MDSRLRGNDTLNDGMTDNLCKSSYVTLIVTAASAFATAALAAFGAAAFTSAAAFSAHLAVHPVGVACKAGIASTACAARCAARCCSAATGKRIRNGLDVSRGQ